MRRIRPVLTDIALAAGSLIVCLLLVEAVARGAVEWGIARSRRQAGALPISRYHPVLGWDKTPGAEQWVHRKEFEVLLRFNSRGLRGPERDYAKPPGTRRVLILGDSFAEGYYANEDETARAVLEGLLNREGCGPYEVLNGGTIAYSTDQEYLFYRTEGQRYGADLVVLFFYYNDLYYNASENGPGGEPKPYFLVKDGALALGNVPVPLLSRGLLNRQNPGVSRPQPWHGSMALRLLSNRTVDASPRLHRVLSHLGLVEPIPSDPPREFWPFGPGHPTEVREAWALTSAILAALRKEVEAHGARLVLFYVPMRAEVNDPVWELTRQRYRLGRRWDRYVVFDRLKSVCEALDIPLVDPREDLRRTEAKGPPAYYTRDVHWTATGNAVAAHVLEPPVRALLPCPTPAVGDSRNPLRPR